MGEIKLSQIVKDHTLEQVMTVGRIYKTDKGVRKIADNFKESSVYNKLKNCSITTYKQKVNSWEVKFQNLLCSE